MLIGTNYNVAALSFQKAKSGVYQTVQTVTSPQRTAFDFSDAALTQGINTYRVQLRLQSGVVVYSNEVSIYHFTNASVILFPNPAPQHTPVTLLTSEAGRVRIAVYDAAGRLLQEQLVPALVNRTGLGLFSKGVYIICITNEEGKRYTQKLLVY